MTVERGFRRIVIVLSLVLLAAGIAFDALILIPHTTVRVTLVDGRQTTLEVHWTGDYPTNPESLARELSERRGLGVQTKDIAQITVLRGPEYWWWTDGVGWKVGAGLVGLLWVGFYTVRWVVRGFSPTENHHRSVTPHREPVRTEGEEGTSDPTTASAPKGLTMDADQRRAGTDVKLRALQLATAEVLGLMGIFTLIAAVTGRYWDFMDVAVQAGIIAWLVFKPSWVATGAGLLLLGFELVFKVLAEGYTSWITTYLVLFLVAYGAQAKALTKPGISRSLTSSQDVCRTCYRRGCTEHQAKDV